jgi:transposase
MATERVSMRKTREILRQRWQLGLSHRKVARSLGVGVATVWTTEHRAVVAGLDWSGVQALADDVLEERLYGSARPGSPGACRPQPDCAWIHTELRKAGVTLQLLHLEYLEKHPEGYQYTRFCEIYRRWRKKQSPVMRQVHRAGEKLFVDYAGKKPHYVDPATGEIVEVELFVAVLGSSNYTYAEATRTQKSQDWIASHVRAFEFFGGVATLLIPDQLKSGVTRPCRYEPGVQRTYEEMASHYGTVVLPARQGKARDKAKVESGVLVAERWILARLRNETFFSLDELNARIRELLHELNKRPMRVYKASRRELFEKLERSALKPLPSRAFVHGEWKLARVNIDYHVEVDGHYYSVPYQLVHETVETRATVQTIEVFHRGARVASHRRSDVRGRHTTNPEHMPSSHRAHAEWTPSRLIRWAENEVGPETARLVEVILADRPHPEQGYRSCLGIMRLAKRYTPERLEAACTRALAVGARSYRHVESILKHGLDRLPWPQLQPEPAPPPVEHENIRGRSYFD